MGTVGTEKCLTEQRVLLRFPYGKSEIFGGLLGAILCIDDYWIFEESTKEHDKRVYMVLLRLLDKGVFFHNLPYIICL